jgi:hypothetical protein
MYYLFSISIAIRRRTRTHHPCQLLSLLSKLLLPHPQNTYTLREHALLTKWLNNRSPDGINGDNNDKISFTVLLQRQKSTRVLSITSYRLFTPTAHEKYEHEYKI